MIQAFSNGRKNRTYFVRASLFFLSKLWPVSAPLSFAFMIPSDCRVGKTASRSYQQTSAIQSQTTNRSFHTADPDMMGECYREWFSKNNAVGLGVVSNCWQRRDRGAGSCISRASDFGAMTALLRRGPTYAPHQTYTGIIEFPAQFCPEIPFSRILIQLPRL
jgi:hypothetical protein